jgi:hypothetical protein
MSDDSNHHVPSYILNFRFQLYAISFIQQHNKEAQCFICGHFPRKARIWL